MEKKKESYIVILPFMVDELNLKGNELLIYACIYGFTQTEGQVYSGGLAYLMRWTGCTKKSVIYILKKLRDRGLIDRSKRASRFDYTANEKPSEVKKVDIENDEEEVTKSYPQGVKRLPKTEGVKMLPRRCKKVTSEVTKCNQRGYKKLPAPIPTDNNKIYNKINNKNINNKKSTEGAKKRLSPFEGKPNIKEQIETYTSSEELRESLSEFVEMRKKLRKPFTDGAFRLMLKKLTEYGKTDEERIEVVNQSIVNGWQGIFPLKAQAHGKDAKNGVLNDWYELFEEGGDNGTDKS